MQKSIRAIGLSIFFIALCAHVAAEEKPSNREREALRRVQQQLQQAQQEKNGLQEKIKSAEQEKGTAESRLLAIQARARTDAAKQKELQIALDQSRVEAAALQTQKTELEQRLGNTISRLSGVEKDLAQTLAQKQLLANSLATRNQQVNSCEDHNRELHSVGLQLIAQCKDSSSTPVVLSLDRLSGVRHVQFEQRLEAHRDQLDAHRVMPGNTSQ